MSGMGFLRLVEVFPPLFRPGSKAGKIDVEGALANLFEGVETIKPFSDVILVAAFKDPATLRMSPVFTAQAIRRETGMNAAPVIVVRDYNRPEFRSMVVTAIAGGLRTMMIVWGDDFGKGGPTNVRDYVSLAEALRDASDIARKAGVHVDFLAPIDVSRLGKGGSRTARSRLSAGAKLLLAQPPAIDTGDLEKQAILLKRAGIEAKTLPGIFPFRSVKDLHECEKKFGWRLPEKADNIARQGPRGFLQAARAVAVEAERSGLPGIYLSTRGDPGVAADVLG